VAGPSVQRVPFQQFVEFIVGRRLDLVFAPLDAVMAVYRRDDFPKRLLFGLAGRPTETGAEGDYFGASEASVVVGEPVALASAGISFPTGSSGTPTM
jgi:hypothetical protein